MTAIWLLLDKSSAEPGKTVSSWPSFPSVVPVAITPVSSLLPSSLSVPVPVSFLGGLSVPLSSGRDASSPPEVPDSVFFVVSGVI